MNPDPEQAAAAAAASATTASSALAEIPLPSSKGLITKLKLDLRTKRALATKLTNKIVEFPRAPDDTYEELRKAVHFRRSLVEIESGLSTAFERVVSLPSVSEDEAEITKEYDKQLEYTEKLSDVIEALTLRISILQDIHGLFADRSIHSGFSQPMQSSPTDYESTVHGTSGQEQTSAQETSGQSQVPQSNTLEGFETVQEEQQWSQQLGSLQNGPPKDPSKKLKKFKGDLTFFQEYWDIFEIHVDSQPLRPSEKFRLLKDSLEGKPLQKIQHLRVMDSSYEMAKKIITERYGNRSEAQSLDIHKIHRFCATMDLQKTDKFTNYVSLLGQHIRSLLALDETFDNLDAALYPVILACIPPRYRNKFNELKAQGNVSEVRLESLLNFLEKEADLLELGEEQAQYSLNLSTRPKQDKKKFFDKKSKNREDQQSRQRSEQTDRKSHFAFAGKTSPANHSCIFCGKDHDSFKCDKPMSTDERRKCVASENACLKCLKRNHCAKKCRSKIDKCPKCAGNHSALVCRRVAPQEISISNTSVATSVCMSQHEIILQTGYVWISAREKKIICRILLDPGSQKSFVSQRLIQSLGLKRKSSERVQIQGIAGSLAPSEQVDIFELKVQSRFSEHQIMINCLKIPKILDGLLPRASYSGRLSPIADRFAEGFPSEIDLLVGADALHLVYDGPYIRDGSLIAAPTVFGWFLWGQDRSNQVFSSVATSRTVPRPKSCAQTSDENDARSKTIEVQGCCDFLWKTEVLGIENSLPDEVQTSFEAAEKFFKSSVGRADSGQYIVTLPFKPNITMLGDNQRMAFSRLMALVKQLKRNPELLKAVDEEIKNYMELGFAERAEPRKTGEQAHYLPLLAVAKKSLSPQSGTKVRVVKDGGSRSKDEPSLNDCLEQGPSLLPDLVAVFMNFRKGPIAVVADIQRAFMRFLISKNQRTFLRFYWPLGISEKPNAPVLELWASVLDFGLVCSPWLHCAGVRHHLDLEIETHPERATVLREIKQSFYMDDICFTCDSVNESRESVKFVSEVFNRGHFPLAKWNSNNRQVAEFIQKKKIAEPSSVSSENLEAKFLGVPWNQPDDYLFINVENVENFMKNSTPSKRNLLKGLSQIFDPLSFLAPLTIAFKILTQKLWSGQIDWDSPLRADLEGEYLESVANLRFASDIRINRAMFHPTRENLKTELHVFADASLVAYGCVAYIRELSSVQGSKKCFVSLAMAKARVAPLKGKWTIHRLELLAAVIAARLAKRIQES